MKMQWSVPVLLSTLLMMAGAATATDGAKFQLQSSDIANNSTIDNKFVFKGFGCTGGNVSPALSWSGAPAGTQSFALLVHDPDAPTGGAGWWHWVIYDIPANAKAIAQGAGTADGTTLPTGSKQGVTDFGSAGWGGPCPPQGDAKHHYHFTLHALKVAKLGIPAGATAALIGYMVNANSIGKAEFTGLYGR